MHTVAVVVCLAQPVVLGAQDSARFQPDSAALIRAELRGTLGPSVYWANRLGNSGVDDCQVPFPTFCAAEHNLGSSVVSTALQPAQLYQYLTAEQQRSIAGIVPRLERALELAPDNGWFAGQLAYLLLIGNDAQYARDVLGKCRGTPWWCSALKAFVLHHEMLYSAADSAFNSALAAMPADSRCRWRDISLLLDDSARVAYERMDCAQRERYEEQVWWLSDPLYMLDGNDRRTEHFARRVQDSLFTGLWGPFHRDTDPALWNGQLSELLMRYGLEGHWISSSIATTMPGPRELWMHYHTPNYHFLPLRAPVDATDTGAPEWMPTVALDQTRERYHPRYSYVLPLSQTQVARFRRGDSLLLVAALDPSREPFAEQAPFVAALSFGAAPGIPMKINSRRNVAAATHLSLTVPATTGVLGLEVMSHRYELAARTRAVTSPLADTRGGSISDLLFFEPDGNENPRALESVLPRMIARDEMVRSEALGVFWESYGFAAGSSISWSISVVPTSRGGGGIFRSLGRALGLSQRPGSTLLRWTQVVDADIAGSSISVDLSSLTPATYSMTLIATTASDTVASATREIRIVNRRSAIAALEQALEQPLPRASTPSRMPRVAEREQPIPPG